MQIGPPFNSPYTALPRHQRSPSNDSQQQSNANQRHRRSIDPKPPIEQELVQQVVPAPQSPGDYREQSVNPDPGKKVGQEQKNIIPTDIGPNINVDPVVQKISDSFKSVTQEASIFLKKKFAEMAEKAKTPAEKEKWNIDPDNTYLVTFDYNTTGEKPYPAKVIKRISLTEALITNAQDTPKGKGYPIPFFSGGPNVIVKPDLKAHKPGIFDFSSRFSPYNEKADITHTYQGIYKESDTSSATVYNEKNQSSITPAQFKELIWKADYEKPYGNFLDDFWSSHKEKYPTLAKASLVKSAMAQHQEGSLTAQGRELIMRAAGLAGHQESWPDITYESLQKNPPKDPTIEVGLLKLGHYQSTDLMYITDTKVKFDAQGNKVPPLTLLYIPGNSSPIHTFKSQAEMKDWLAKQMADPAKRAALAGHFPQKDKPNGYARAGIDETLTGLGTWPERREIPGGLFSYNNRAFSGYWNPQEFITTEPTKLPFDEITKRQKERSYSDATVTITSDADVTKKTILSGLEKAAKVAMFLTPLALAMPEVALALDAFYLACGVTEAGLGVDDAIKGKPQGTERIVFGLFNAGLVVAPRILKPASKGEGIAEEIEPTEVGTRDDPEPANEPAAAEDEPAIESSQNEPGNPLRPSQAGNISAYAIADGKKLISTATRNSKGIYQVKGGEGDRWFITLKDDKNVERVFEIDSRFKLSDDYVQIIDPATRKPAVTAHSTQAGNWTLVNGPGGVNLPWGRAAVAKKQLNKMIKNIETPTESLSEADRKKFSDELTDLIQKSKAEEYQSLSEYTEAGSDEINDVLRKQTNPDLYPQNVKEFLSDFAKQSDYNGVSYRYAHVSPEGAKSLKSGVGKVFRDTGVQSASTQASNAKDWNIWADNIKPAEKTIPVVYIFDEYIPKKNLSNSMLPDHVAVPPDTSLEVLATKEKNGVLYVYFGGPTKMPKQRYNLFDGSVAWPF